MSRVCKGCGFWIEFISGEWLDEFDDCLCYDEDLNLIGYHQPE